MAKHKYDSGDLEPGHGPDPLTKEEQSSPMAATPYPNGPVPDESHSIRQAIASKKAYAWAKGNALTLVGIALACGAVWLLPVSRWQLQEAKDNLQGQIQNVSTKVESLDKDIAEIKAAQIRAEDTSRQILFKLSSYPSAPAAPFAEPPRPIPAAQPSPKKPPHKTSGLGSLFR